MAVAKLCYIIVSAMFPTLHYIVDWLTGWNLPLPIPTFGCCMALAFWLAWWVFTLELKRKQKPAAIPAAIPAGIPAAIPASISVPRLMDRLLLWCGVIGFAGALLLAKLEDSYNLRHHPLNWLLTYHGLNYYGGLLFGAITYLIILHRRGISLATAADIGSPGMMLAYAVGRIGCHLAGDGCWGIVNTTPKPHWLSWAPDWTWAAHYPHNAIRQGVFIPGCRLDYCSVLPEGVFPTSLYEAVTCLVLFILLWSLRRHLHASGLLFFVYALLTGLERFLIEFIRINPKHQFLGYELTQAQMISLALMAIGIAGIGYILATKAKKAYFYTTSVCQDPSSKKVRR